LTKLWISMCVRGIKDDFYKDFFIVFLEKPYPI
jgi:hypothetical protein